MARKDRRGARSGRKSRRKRDKGRKPAASEDEAKTHAHPVYGPIPLIVRTWTDADGTPRASYDFDPDYQPPLPEGAVRGDVRRQRARGAFDTPRYFYVDIERTCVQCGDAFVFRASEQKYWYESLGFNFASRAIRCSDCRRKRRSDKALHHAVEQAKRELEAAPEDPARLLALAEAIVQLRVRRDRGKLHEAVAAARKARKQLRDRPASARVLTHYWEGRAQALRERADKAREAFECFLVHAKPKAHRREIRVAEVWLSDNP